jgi:beta-ureidopropionase
MPRLIKSGLIQAATEAIGAVDAPDAATVAAVKEANIQRHLPFIERAGAEGVQILCLQEIFATPYFCPGQNAAWYAAAEPVPGPTTERMAELAARHRMVMIVPVYEKEQPGVLYNTAAVIDADGSYLGKYRKSHLPHTNGFWEKFFFRPGNLGYPVFETAYARVGVYICYDRHFPEGARALGLNGAEIVYNPSATVAGLSEYLWKLEQPAHAAANGYFMGCNNRVGTEAPWGIGEFYGQSYFVDPRGQIIAQASRDRDELLVAEFDLDLIDEVRSTWQFFRDRRPETYDDLIVL